MAGTDYNQLYITAANENDVDPIRAQAIGMVESANNPNAVSSKGAQGNMQLMPATARGLGVNNINDPKENIPAGIKYYAQNKTAFRDPDLGLVAYNYGPGNTRKWLNNGADPAALPKETRDYVQKVHQTEAQLRGTMATPQNTDVAEKNLSGSPVADDDLDVFEGAKKDIAAAKAKDAPPSTTVADEDLDPFEGAKKDIAAAKTKEDAKKPPMSVSKDLALTGVSAPIKAIGALTQIPAMIGNAAANSMGYVYGKLAEATPEQQEKLNTLNPFFTGNTSLDALTQAGKAIVSNDPGKSNPLTGEVLHDPETMPGRYVNALVQGAVGGPTTGLRMAPSLIGAAGAQTASETFPNNPLAPVIGGLVAGGAPAAISALKLRASPEELANNVLQNSSGGPPGPGGAGNALLPENINSHEIIPGSKPTLAQITDDPNIALLERQLQAKNPAAFKALEDVNENARQAHFERAAGTPEDIEALENEREANSSPLYEQARKQPLQTEAVSPILSKIDAAIEEVGDGSDAGKTLATIRKKIENALPSTDESGKVRNPTQSPLVQIYREERDNLQKPATADGAYAATVKSVIQPIVSELGKAIESQSEPFAKAQQIYRDTSPKIEAARWLQGLKLTDATERFTLAKVNNALKNAQRLQNSTGLNSAKNLSPEQMNALTQLRDDLLRRENVARASMPRGSNTAQNLLAEADAQSLLGKANKLIGGHGPEAIGSAAGYGVGTLMGSPGAGAFLGDIAARYLQGKSGARSGAATNALQNFVLNPESYKEFLLNANKDNYLERATNSLLQK